MAIDSQNKRASAFGLANIIFTLPVPDGSITAPDRLQVAGLYCGIIAGAGITDIGLRIKDANGIQIIACQAYVDHFIHIRGTSETFGVVLVDPSDPNAMQCRVYDGADIKAIRTMGQD